MKTVQLTLSDQAASDVERLTRERGFADVGAYLESLVLADRQRRALDRLEAEGLKALESGPARELTDDLWVRIRAEHERRQRAGKEAEAPQ